GDLFASGTGSPEIVSGGGFAGGFVILGNADLGRSTARFGRREDRTGFVDHRNQSYNDDVLIYVVPNISSPNKRILYDVATARLSTSGKLLLTVVAVERQASTPVGAAKPRLPTS